ncbi:uncharacterized protein [Cicer arietinum]|uniref:Uncharacterized protein LOC105852999 n=1 Tax=Cicer arietinum TaxID=3827 RepID=A0A1S3EKE6_CICAR|nr:uncharacterized protein LOC105852999 [Cicer arietinum]
MAYSNSYMFLGLGLFIILSSQVLAQVPLLLPPPPPPPPTIIYIINTMETPMTTVDSYAGLMHEVTLLEAEADRMTFRANLIKKNVAKSIHQSRKFLNHLFDEEDKVSKSNEEDKVSITSKEDKVFRYDEEDKISNNEEKKKVLKNEEKEKVFKSDKEDKVFKNDNKNTITN